MSEPEAIEAMRSAECCNLCFQKTPGIRRPARGLQKPKPRWIGKDYWTKRPRIVFILIQPGSANDKPDSFHEREATAFSEFYRNGCYDTVQNYLHGRYFDQKSGDEKTKSLVWYEDIFGVNFEEIALVNMAWCATYNDLIASGSDKELLHFMLKTCFENHTRSLVEALEPDAVILSGKGAFKPYLPVFEKWLGFNRVRLIHHYNYYVRTYGNDTTGIEATMSSRLSDNGSEPYRANFTGGWLGRGRKEKEGGGDILLFGWDDPQRGLALRWNTA